MARLRGRGEVQSIDAATLAFSEAEVGELLTTELGSAELAPAVHELTSGWPAAVRLAVEALRGTKASKREGVLRSLPRPGGPIFNYLAEEALAGEDAQVRELVRRAASFDRFTPDLCAEVGIEGAAEALPRLAARGFLVQAEGGEEDWFALHGLLREFAAKHWPLRADELGQQQLKAARWFESRGDLHSALDAATTSGNQSELARLITQHGDELLTGGALDAIQQAAASLPSTARDGRLEEIIGEAHALKGEWDEALACYEQSGRGPRLSVPGPRLADRPHPLRPRRARARPRGLRT